MIGGFGGHCDLFNYTGMLVAVSKSPGIGLSSYQSLLLLFILTRVQESPRFTPWSLVLGHHQLFRILPSNKVGKPEFGKQVRDLLQMGIDFFLSPGTASKYPIVYK